MELRQVQKSAGAIISDADVILGFDHDTDARNAIEQGVAICDRSHWGLL